MRIRADLTDDIVEGLQEVRHQFEIPAEFPAEVLQYAERSFYTQAKKITELATDANDETGKN